MYQYFVVEEILNIANVQIICNSKYWYYFSFYLILSVHPYLYSNIILWFYSKQSYYLEIYNFHYFHLHLTWINKSNRQIKQREKEHNKSLVLPIIISVAVIKYTSTLYFLVSWIFISSHHKLFNISISRILYILYNNTLTLLSVEGG